jgi:hypothetical protein
MTQSDATQRVTSNPWTTISSTSTYTATPAATPQRKTWIVGAVVGPVATVALCLGVFIYWRRRKRTAVDGVGQGEDPVHVGSGHVEVHPQTEKDAHAEGQPAAQENARAELPAEGPAEVSELSG